MHDDAPELYVPARERPRRANWLLTIARLYWAIGVLVIAMALYVGLKSMPLGHLRDGLLPAAITTLCWYGFGRVVGWIFQPALPQRDEQR